MLWKRWEICVEGARVELIISSVFRYGIMSASSAKWGKIETLLL